MPYRVEIPEGETALDHILNAVGTPSLIEVRKQLISTVYLNQDTTLTHREREGMRILGTVVVNCPICNSLRLWRDYPGFCDEEIPEDFYQNALNKNYDWQGFNQREVLAIQFADRFHHDIENLNGDDDYWQQIHQHFSEREIGDLCFFNSYFIGTGYTIKALGIGSVCDILPAADSDAVKKIIRQG